MTGEGVGPEEGVGGVGCRVGRDVMDTCILGFIVSVFPAKCLYFRVFMSNYSIIMSMNYVPVTPVASEDRDV